ncbi:uncharacterized protein [Miscanthus floridulus]|uniref:uncharacterized protein n=1 Tax=Miscanthus floridulus TaxID=154761 RepID=UPI00345869A0
MTRYRLSDHYILERKSGEAAGRSNLTVVLLDNIHTEVAKGRARPLLVLASLCAAAAALLPHGAAAAAAGWGRVASPACRCKPGWSRYHLAAVQFPFLPCVIPNCKNKTPRSPLFSTMILRIIDISASASLRAHSAARPTMGCHQPQLWRRSIRISLAGEHSRRIGVGTKSVMACCKKYCGDCPCSSHAGTIHSSCQDGSPSSSPAPAPSPPPPAVLPPLTTFDPCLMQYCGDGGTCEKASDFTHCCSCRDGYANLLNDTSYPCYQHCSLGSDCKGLGIDVINGSTPSSSPPAPFSFTVKKSGAGAAAAAPADTLLGLLLLLTFYGLQ